MKKLLLVITVMMFVCATSYAQSVVQSGTFFYSKDSPNYTLHTNQGKRLVEYEINFNKPFDKKPKVVIMPSLLDAERATQVRYNIRATGVSRDGFVLLAEVWGDTQLNSIGGFWLAHTEE
ncbi:MAG: H-type lectin domain-containing protein [Melioribacteraceae bacterium]